MSSTSSRQQLNYFASIAEMSARYEVQLESELNVEERNNLSAAYQNAIYQRRTALYIFNDLYLKEASIKGSQKLKTIKEYKTVIESELKKFCYEIIKLIDDILLPNSKNDENTVFYFKMKGDYYRYLTEFLEADERLKSADYSLASYNHGLKLAQKKLECSNSIKLGLCLNFSVFYHEILGDYVGACRMAQDAYNSALNSLDNLSEEEYKETLSVMELLKDNLSIWEN